MGYLKIFMICLVSCGPIFGLFSKTKTHNKYKEKTPNSSMFYGLQNGQLYSLPAWMAIGRKIQVHTIAVDCQYEDKSIRSTDTFASIGDTWGQNDVVLRQYTSITIPCY